MINKFALFFTNKFLLSRSDPEEERELYVYGIFVTLSNLLYLVLALIFGLLLNCFVESIFYFFSFRTIRIYAGGYHAKTEFRCEFFSTLLIFTSLLLIKFYKLYDIELFLILCYIISIIVIYSFSPLDNEEKALSVKEKKYYRKKSLIFTAVVLILIIAFYTFKLNSVAISCCVGVIAEGLLLGFGKIKEKSKNHKIH